MPRKARQISPTGIYHIILRGNNRQIIFDDDNDYHQFISILKYYKKICNFELYAFCLMSNHVHLLLKEGDEPLYNLMRRIEVKYVKWFNQKYDRCGYCFQDRYKSEPVNNETFFLTVFRYIHQNPMHAMLEKYPGKYRWSSFEDYKFEDASWIDIHIPLSYFDNVRACVNFLREDSKEICMEDYCSRRIPDDVAKKMITSISGCDNLANFCRLEVHDRVELLGKLMDNGLSIRQLSRLTGISRPVIERAKRDRCVATKPRP